MPPWRCLRSPGPTWLLETVARGRPAPLVWVSCPDKGLAGAVEVAPVKRLAGETCFAHLHFVALVLDVALFVSSLRLLSGLPPLPCYVRPWRVALTARAQVKVSKGDLLLLYTDRGSPPPLRPPWSGVCMTLYSHATVFSFSLHVQYDCV